MTAVVYQTTERPSRRAKKAREIWDRITAEDGEPPRELKLVFTEGGWRDWWFLRHNGEFDEIEAGKLGWRYHRSTT